VVGWLNFQFPKIVDRCLDAFVVRTDHAIYLLDMRSESRIELLQGTCSGGLKLWQYSLFPLMLSDLLRMGNSVRTMFGVIDSCKIVCRIIDLRLDAVDMRLNFLNMRRKILVVIRLNVWFQVISSLEVGLA